MPELTEPNSLGDICGKLLSDPYVLFLVTAAMFFDDIPSLVLIIQVVSEEKSFL